MSSPTLSPERWNRVQDLFHRAAEMTGDQRNQFLNAECGDDAALRREVESLLHANTPSGFLGSLADVSGPHLSVPASVGPYRVLRLIGEGGMGAVYHAEREGQGFTQTVALKLLRRDADSPLFEDRLVEERRILARLEHPGIARMIDGGATEDGQPFIAMEFVEGEEVLAYCDRRGLSIAQRIRIFIDICDAVYYAHQQLIVHRDIKPNNILVSEDGRPKLLDFGVAKLLHTTQGRDQDRHTGQWLTPAYASPEQVNGDRLSTLSDEYALGVLFYELMTGMRPYEMDTSDRDSIVRVVCAEVPPLPSQSVSGHETPADNANRRGLTVSALSRRLAGDLDAITMRALAKDPADRYPSVLALADDLTRHLEGFPVHARPATPVYRLRRLVYRHGVAAMAVIVGSLFLVGGVGASFWQAGRATRQAELASQERIRAQEQATKASLITSLMVDLFQLSDPTNVQGDTLTAREILDQGTARIERDFGNQPDIQAAVLAEVSRVYANLGMFDRAEALIRRSMEITGNLFGTTSPETSERLAQLGSVLYQQGRPEEAASYYRQTIRLREHLAPDSLLSAAKAELAWLLRDMREYDEAATLFSTALEEQRAMFGDERSDVASTLLGLASTYHDQGAFDDAEALFDRALTRFDTAGGRPHPAAAEALMNIGLIRRLREQYASAEPLTRRGMQMTQALYANDHPAVLLNEAQYAALLYDLGRYPEALAILESALERAARALGPLNNRTSTVRHTLASVYNSMGEYARSAVQFDSVIAIQRRDYGDHPQVVFTILQAANPHIAMGDLDRAEALLRESLDMGLLVSGERSVYRALTLVGLARIQLIRGDVTTAAGTIAQGRALAADLLSRPTHRYLLYADRVHAEVLLAQGDYARVIELMEFGLESLRAHFQRHRDIGRTLQLLAQAQAGLGDVEQARQLLEEALTHYDQLPDDHAYPRETRALLEELRGR